MAVDNLYEETTRILTPLGYPILDPAGVEPLGGPFLTLAFAGANREPRDTYSIEVGVWAREVTQLKAHATLETVVRAVRKALIASPLVNVGPASGGEVVEFGEDIPNVEWVSSTMTVSD